MTRWYYRAQATARLRRLALRLIALAMALGFAGALPACNRAPTLKVAVALSTTGAAEPYGNPALDGARLAVEEANAAGEGPRIELAVYDDTSNEERGREVARRIIASDALVVVGPATTPMALAVGPVYSEAGVACVGTTATGDGVTANATFFRASFSTSDGGEALANYLHHVLGGSRAIVLFKDDGYGQPVAAGFKRTAEHLGIATTYRSFKTVAEAEEAARFAASEPDHPAIILAMIDAVQVLTTLRRAGARGSILGTNAMAGEYFSAFFANLPEERQNPGYFTDGVYAASPLMFDSANAETLAFVDRFRARFGREPSYISVHGYESTRLAVAAARAAGPQTNAGSDMRARREAVRVYLASLDGPARAVPGLNGPLWFTPERGRQQALRIGRFQGATFVSAPSQLVPVRNPDVVEIASGALVDIGSGRFARRQQVVYTGIYLNEIARLDIAQSRFTADFYLWLRFARNAGAGAADPAEIDFPDLVRGSSDGKLPAAQRDLDDGTTYRLWRIRSDFKNDFDLHNFPADSQSLAIRFFNARAASDRLVYVQDRRSFGQSANGPPPAATAEVAKSGVALAGAPSRSSAADQKGAMFGSLVAPEAFRNLTQWEPMRASQRRDSLVTKSALGDPGLVGFERVRELSGFAVAVDLQRRVVATLAKTLLPLGLMALIMYASLHFPVALVKEKVTVAITGALSGAVLLSSINSQLGNVGYVMAVEYGFYIFFSLCLLCIVSVLVAERYRVAGQAPAAAAVEQWGRLVFLLASAGTAVAGLVAYWR